MLGGRKELGWYSKTVSETRGPKQGVVRAILEYENCDRQTAEAIQNKLIAAQAALNQGK